MEDEGFSDRSRRDNFPHGLDRKYDLSRNIDEGYHSLPGSSFSSTRLHGERQLEQRNVESASQAYDNKLLSKIGKPKTPPDVSRTSSVDAASPSSSLSSFYQSGRHPHPLKSLSISEGSTNSYPNSPYKREPLSSRSAESPRSRAISPSLLSSAASAKSYMDWRSPTWEGGTPTSAGSETHSRGPRSRFGSFSSQYQQQQQQQRHQSRRRSLFSNHDDSAAGLLVSEGASRGSKRGSQDQSSTTLPESDSTTEFPYMEETRAMRQLHLEDRASLSLDPALQQYSSSPVINSDPRLGMKRRASSPPPDSTHEDQKALVAQLHSAVGSTSNNNDLYQRQSQPAHPANRASPVNRFAAAAATAAQQSSVSSASSAGLRNGSYASSGPLSVGSSLASVSPNHERHSPPSEYPYPQPHPDRDTPYITSHPSPQSSLSHPHSHPMADTPSTSTSRKLSSDTSTPRKPNNPPNIQAPMHICKCCPKKPKKFDTVEDLRTHESEKQYACHFCHNRFKNKNEAERHQNSLHVRRHSWSCATLSDQYERVFHPSTSIPPQHSNQNPPPPDTAAATDICGYCGQEFNNEPQPDWGERVAHLTNVHKFGECNQAKKFFRADHFRQHLKHSHAGTSGKWTNMLEAECMKDEPVPEMMPQPQQMPQSMQPMQQAIPQPMQAPMHQMQEMAAGAGGPSMQQGLGGAPVANMGVMAGTPSGRPAAMVGPSGLSSETIDEMKEEM
ncbi:MAG: hypothetical protein Q9200_006631 [Gallowayella weberi]